MMKSVASLCLVLFAACTTTKAPPPANPEQPAALVGAWVSPYGGDTLVIRQNGTAQRSGVVMDATWKAWRVIVDSTTHRATLCFESGGIGNTVCGPLTVAGKGMTVGDHAYNRTN